MATPALAALLTRDLTRLACLLRRGLRRRSLRGISAMTLRLWYSTRSADASASLDLVSTGFAQSLAEMAAISSTVIFSSFLSQSAARSPMSLFPIRGYGPVVK